MLIIIMNNALSCNYLIYPFTLSYKASKAILLSITFLLIFIEIKNIIRKKQFKKDVLFINGCNPNILNHPYRYRVLHQMEQLEAGFVECDESFYLNFEPLIIRYYRVIIFFRCPWTEKVNEAITLAKSLNKKILFDIDDLVIDTKYTNMIPYIKALSKEQKEMYDDGVNRMKKTLKLCHGAITTTETLATELKHYVSNVFINHNVASEKMWRLSEDALSTKIQKKKTGHIIIGYFSGSITHNPDFEMIKPALLKILKEYKNVRLLVLGELSIGNILNEFPSQISLKKFIDWKQLPTIISNVDINIAPIENSTFNLAKSENKWVEASLVKVPTVASNYGEFKRIIKQNETGLLCSDLNDWYISLKILINNESLRKIIGNNAYQICRKEYNTIYNHKKLVNFINSFSSKNIGFFLPSLQISGGVYVALKHAIFLKEEGWDVDLIVPNEKYDLFEFEGHKFNIISLSKIKIKAQYDIVVATLYTTFFKILKYYKAKNHFYLVQNYETDFLNYADKSRISSEKTYSFPFDIKYITISKWCQSWLFEKYNKNSSYAPNGIDFDNIKYHMRNLLKKKIRILIEGDSSLPCKNVDESFKIVEKLDKNKFEIWYLSYKGKPKYWYYVNKFFNKIPHEKVNQIYYECDILLKSSLLESFSYPPLEMMATGGYSIVVPNEGNKEFLKDRENCIFYKSGDINEAIKAIQTLISDKKLQEHLFRKGIETARERNWKNFRNQIIHLYDT